MTVRTEISGFTAGIFAVEGMRVVASADAHAGIYPATIAVTFGQSEGQSQSFAQMLTLSAAGFAFEAEYLANDGAGARIMPAAVLDFSDDRYFLIGGDP